MLTVFFTAVAVLAPANEKIGVFNLNVVGLEPAMAQTAMDAVATAAAALPGRQLITRNELDAMLGAERLKDMVGCDEASCFAEIGAAAGVRWLVTGSLSRVEEALLVSLQLVDTQAASAAGRVTMSWNGPVSAVAAVLGAAVETLLLRADEKRPGVVTLAGVPPEAVVLLDGAPAPGSSSALTPVTLGLHVLRVEVDGFEPFEAPLVVRNGAVTALSVNLVEVVAPPLYSRWWFWTGLAVIAAGGTAAAVALSADSTGGGADGPGGDPNNPQGSGTFTVGVPSILQLVGGGR